MRKKRELINHNENIGKKFNKLLVLDVIKRHYGNANMWAYYYICKCECGNVKDIRADAVIKGHIKSCGCFREVSEKVKEATRKMGLNNRKHEEKCDYCGANNHYANGLCRNCYERLRRNGDLEYRRGNKKEK